MKKKDQVTAFLGKGTEFDGKLTFHGTTRIDGHFKGEIQADGNLIISEEGLVEADMHASTIAISGEIHGNITADQRVDIHSPAKVFGDIKAPSVVIDEGVIFEGRTRMYRPPKRDQARGEGEKTPEPKIEEEPAPPLSTLSGTVTDQSTGKAIPQARVKCKGDGKRETETDLVGYFQFGDLKEGTWELKIKADGYHKGKAQVEISGGGILEHNISLEPKKKEES
jgi:cytoskeletal protein CcmA (bactofilin family)